MGWQFGQANTPDNTNAIIFEAYKPSADERADIAIDDVEVTAGPCTGSSPQLVQWQTQRSAVVPSIGQSNMNTITCNAGISPKSL